MISAPSFCWWYLYELDLWRSSVSSPWPSKTCCVYRPQGIATPPVLYSYSVAAPGPAHRVVCRSKFPWSIKSSPPALPFDTLVTGMVWPIVFPNQITEMHILHEVRTQKRKLARVWVSSECRGSGQWSSEGGEVGSKYSKYGRVP